MFKMEPHVFLSECPQTIFFGTPGKMLNDHPIISADSHMENHGFITIKPQSMEEIVLNTNHIGHFIFQETDDNEMIVEQNVEVGGNENDPNEEIILVPNKDIIEASEVIVDSNVDSEVIIGDQLDADRFVIGSSIEMGPDEIDDETFDDTKLIIDTVYALTAENEDTSNYCEECGTFLNSRALLKKHMKTSHGKVHKTKNRRIVYKDDVSNKRYLCPSCPYSTQRRDKLDKHMQKHVLLDGVHPCGKKRHKPHALPQRHRHNAEEYKCPQCLYSCTVYKALKKHLKQHTSGVYINPLKMSCKICGKDRDSEEDMKKHMKKHRNGENFLCDLCSFSSIQLKKIIQHRRMHTGEKPHLCPHCNYRSARRDNLRSHVRRMHKKDNMYIDTFNPNEDLSRALVLFNPNA